MTIYYWDQPGFETIRIWEDGLRPLATHTDDGFPVASDSPLTALTVDVERIVRCRWVRHTSKRDFKYLREEVSHAEFTRFALELSKAQKENHTAEIT